MGLHNTTHELIEAQCSSRILRFSRTSTGRHILPSLHINPIHTPYTADTMKLPIKPLPCNMDPLHYAARRMARPKHHTIYHPPTPTTIYVGVAQHPNNSAYTIS